MTPPASSPRMLQPAFVRVTIANFFFFLAFASFFLLPLHIRALGGSEREVGFVMGTGGLSGLASVFVIGALLDRFGRRVFLRGGFVAMGVVSAAFLLCDRVGPALYLLRGVQGLAFAAGFNAAATLAAELAPPDRLAAALGLFGVSTHATHAIAPSLGELIVRWGGFEALFVIAALYAFTGAAIAWSLPVGHYRSPTATGRVRLTPALGSTVVAVALCGAAFGSVITFVPTYVQTEHLGAVSIFFLSYTVTAVMTRVVFGGISDSRNRRQVILPAMLLLAVSIALLAYVHSTLALAGTGLLFGTAQGFVYPTLNAFTVDQAAAGQMGRVQALYNGTFNLGVTLGSVALGPVVHDHGHRVMFLCSAGAALGALAVFGIGARRAS